MNRSLYHLTRLIAPALILAAGLAVTHAMAEDAPAEPDLDAVLTDLAKIGPDQLVAHVESLRKQVGDLKAEAEAATKRAAELEAQSAAVKERVETIEKFMAAVTASMAPAPEAKPEEAPAPEAKAEAAPEEAKPEPAPEAKAEAASEPAPEAAAG